MRLGLMVRALAMEAETYVKLLHDNLLMRSFYLKQLILSESFHLRHAAPAAPHL